MATFTYRIKEVPCKVCGRVFSASHATGRLPAVCSDGCRIAAARNAEQKRGRLVCGIEGCGKVARPGQIPLCGMHYHRQYRTGELEIKQKSHLDRQHTGGYILIYAPDHPLVLKHTGKYEYQHRVVFYDNNGNGPFVCHVCGKDIGWDTMHVDHLNDAPDDNRIENLAPACPLCNTGRGYEKLRNSLRSRLGVWIEYNGIKDTTNGWRNELASVVQR